jgi:hypothetical protein
MWLTKKQTLYGSVSGDFENFGAGADDDDAVIYVIAANELNTIRWMAAMSHLLMGTVAQEFQATGGTDKALTPTNVRIRPVGKRGSDYTVDKLFVETQILFLQRGAAKLRELSYTWEADAYKAPDISILSEHLFREGIVEMAHCATPDSIIVCVRSDGVLVTCAYEREENIIGWAHQTTDGLYESVAVIPNGLCAGSQDEIWVAVKRTIDGATVRTIEVFDGAYNTDAARVYSGTAVTEVVGLEHLEGEAVDVVADGAAWSATVDGGRIELAAAAETVEVGLPFDTTIVTLRPEFPVQDGTAQARHKSWHEIVVRLWCTSGAPLINGEAVPLDTIPFTGDIHRYNVGWNNEGRITVQQLDPFPITVLGITGDINIADD